MADRRSYQVRFQAPTLPTVNDIERYFAESRDTRWFSNNGPCHRLLVSRLAADLRGAHVVPVNNATAGLMVGIRALAGTVSERRYVIVPSYTFIATVSAITWAGFEPIFVDVDPDSWHMDSGSLAKAAAEYGDQVALVMACSTFGTLQSEQTLGQLHAIATDLGVPLLVDSAAGYGSELPNGTRRGCDGDVDVYSFHATKPFAIGEGGLLVSRDPDIAERAASLVNFGFDVRHLVGDEIGLNAKLDEWHCATALAVHDGFEGVLASRRERSGRVKGDLAAHGYVSQAGSERSSNQFIAVLAPDHATRECCLQLSRDRGIEFRDYYRDPLHTLPALSRYPAMGDLPVTLDLAQRALSLPLANDTTDDELAAVIEVCVDATSASD